MSDHFLNNLLLVGKRSIEEVVANLNEIAGTVLMKYDYNYYKEVQTLFVDHFDTHKLTEIGLFVA